MRLPERRIATRFQRLLLAWYRQHGRDLPWRRTREPYRILVSEIMLQQTQVDRVLPKYRQFLHRYPTMEALAEASVDDVVVDIAAGTVGVAGVPTSGITWAKLAEQSPEPLSADFIFDQERNSYVCPGGAELTSTGNIDQGHIVYYRASRSDCSQCSLKPKCTTAVVRKITRDLNEDVRDRVRALANTDAFQQSRRERRTRPWTCRLSGSVDCVREHRVAVKKTVSSRQSAGASQNHLR